MRATRSAHEQPDRSISILECHCSRVRAMCVKGSPTHNTEHRQARALCTKTTCESNINLVKQTNGSSGNDRHGLYCHADGVLHFCTVQWTVQASLHTYMCQHIQHMNVLKPINSILICCQN